MTSATAKVKRPEATEAVGVQPAAGVAEPPAIKPSHVTLNSAGHVWRDLLVRAPKNLVADDLGDPRIWRQVQAVPISALVVTDHLLILAHDQSWGAEALVRFASNTEARLVVTRVFGFAAVGDSLFSDGTLEVFWDGASYGVRRVADKVPVAQGFASEGLAIDALRAYYPKVVGR